MSPYDLSAAPPVWSHDVQANPRPALRGRRDCDLVVVGAGFSGLHAALATAERGDQVIVLERRTIGAEASGRNAGGCVATWLNRTPSDVERVLGGALGGRLNASYARAPLVLTEIVARYAIKCDLALSGAVIVADSPKRAAAIEHLAGEWRARGARTRMLDAKDLKHELRGAKAACGVKFLDGGRLHPLKLAYGLAEAAKHIGADVFEQSAVIGLTRDGPSGWIVRTAEGEAHAPRVALAVDGFAHMIDPALRAGYRAPYAVIASAPDQLAADSFASGAPVADTSAANPLWVMADDAGRLIMSMTPPIAEIAPLATLAAMADRRLSLLFPDLAPIEWRCAWTGALAMSRLQLPRITVHGEGLFALGGYSGQGILGSLVAARALVRLMHGEEAASLDVPVVPAEKRSWLDAIMPSILRYCLFPMGRFARPSYGGIQNV